MTILFQAILCDDNEIILEGLSRQVNWTDLGIHLAGTASDGNEAWELIQQSTPDILITDIRMPYLDGLELSKRTKELNPNLVILIISAYDDFQYARTAMHLNALDYILKPIDITLFDQLLNKAVQHCYQLHRNKRLIITEFLRKATTQSYDPLQSLDTSSNLELNTDSYCCILNIVLDEHSLNKLSDTIRYNSERDFLSLIDCLNQGNCYLLESGSNIYTAALLCSSKLELITSRKILVDTIRQVFPYDNRICDVVITFGNIYLGIHNLYQSMKDSQEALKMHFVKGSNSDIFFEEISSYIDLNIGTSYPLPIAEKDLIALIKTQNKQGIEHTLQELHQWLFHQGKESYLYMTFSISSLYTNMVNELGQSGLDIQDIFENPLAEFKKIATSGTLETSIKTLKNILFKICDNIEISKSHYRKSIHEALNYIQNHYNDSSLSIETVASKVCLSTSYFSTIFKNETGTTFTDYLIQLRMKHAKELLNNTNLKMYEISSLVGYDNAAYFSVAFKRYWGHPPSKFQNK